MNQIDKLKEEYCNLLNEYQVNAEDWDCFPELGWSWIIQNFTPKEEMTKMLDRVEKEVIENSLESLLLPNGQKLELLNYTKVYQLLNKFKEDLEK